MQTEFITQNLGETKKLGKLLATELCGGEVICLSGELGAGKTTFTQGLLAGLGAEKPYTSPTFVVMKEYEIAGNKHKLAKLALTKSSSLLKLQKINNAQKAKSKKQTKIHKIYHFDVYRVGAEDILKLGWEEIIADKSNICIVEWAEKLKEIIPARVIWIRFEWLTEQKRRIIVGRR